MASANHLSSEMDQLCANCQNEGTIVCTDCKLVLYCGEVCRKRHLSQHQPHCKSPLSNPAWKPLWEVEVRVPSIVKLISEHQPIYLWGNMPAIDILNLAENEQATWTKDINLLFAASGDLRNVIQTVANLPITYSGKSTIWINDQNINVVCRNTLMLLVLCSPEDEAKAIDTALHVWYSALLRPDHMELIRKTVRPRIESFYERIQGAPPKKSQREKWNFGACTIDVSLKPEYWTTLLSHCDEVMGLSADEAQRMRRAKYASEVGSDKSDLKLMLNLPEYRVSMQRFEEDGILLPFGCSREPHTVPNPTLFFSRDWHLRRQESPLCGWNRGKVTDVHAGPAINDLYGKLYCHVKALLREFRTRLMTLNCNIRMSAKNATKLVPRSTKFDRIECSNIADRGYLGLRHTVGHLSNLLESQDENSHATLITLTMNGIPEALEVLNSHDREKVGIMLKNVSGLVETYFSTRLEISEFSKTHLVPWVSEHFMEMGPLFELYKNLYSFSAIAERNKMRMKRRHIIVEKYPSRLRKELREAGGIEEFWNLLSDGHTGIERYMEWQRV